MTGVAARAPSRHAIPGRLAARLVQWYMQSCVLSTSATARAARASALVHLEPPLDRLCAYARLKPSGRCLQWRMLLALYAPIGLALVAARMLFLLAAVISLACLSVLGAALPFLWTTERIDDAATHVLRALCWGLGFVVRVRSVGTGGHPRHSSQGAPPTVDDALATLQAATMIVANHVSQWDGLPIRLLTPCATLVRETYTRRGVSGSLAARIATGCLVAPIVSTAFTPIPVPTPSRDGGSIIAILLLVTVVGNRNGRHSHCCRSIGACDCARGHAGARYHASSTGCVQWDPFGATTRPHRLPRG